MATNTSTSSGPRPQLLARARYNNLAEAPDELSFRQGDIVTVVQKDFNKQLDWWLCELRGNVGMVPANYFEVFHDHDGGASYDVPRPSSKGSRTSASPQATPLRAVISPQPLSTEATDSPIYDLPPRESEATDRDYDLPPPETNSGVEIYDRPPSASFISPPGSTRSSMKSMNRVSTASSAASSNCIYDVPPDLLDVYDFPKPSQPTKGFEEEHTNTLQAIDIGTMMDDEAEELLSSYRQVITVTYEALYNSVYGPEAYWGTDHKDRRSATLSTTITAVRHFDKALLILLQFGKGVVNKLEYVSDVNFKKKYSNAFKGLLHNRNDILGKLEILVTESDAVTGTVKSLLEIARTIPRVVTEFTILVQANKAILFKTSNKSSGNLPVITKSEVKSRPLPELPQPIALTEVKEGDYAVPVEAQGDEGRKVPGPSSESSLDFNSTLNRRRKPNDTLPPLPYATLPRSGRSSPGMKLKNPEQNVSTSSMSPHNSRSNVRTHPSPIAVQKKQVIEMPSEDYDEIDKTRDRSVVLTSRPSQVSIGSNSSRGASPVHLHMRRPGSLSSCSSSDDLNNSSGMRRANSVELLDCPYGRPSGCHHQRQNSSPQPLKMEEKRILERFAKQFDLIIPGLRESIDMLTNCLRENETPRDFVTKSKLTVVAAYKLVYVADALSQKIVHNETRSSIMASSNDLTENIKNLVSATKTAALQYPSVIALDKMGSNIKLLYPCALDLINSVKSRAV